MDNRKAITLISIALIISIVISLVSYFSGSKSDVKIGDQVLDEKINNETQEDVSVYFDSDLDREKEIFIVDENGQKGDIICNIEGQEVRQDTVSGDTICAPLEIDR